MDRRQKRKAAVRWALAIFMVGLLLGCLLVLVGLSAWAIIPPVWSLVLCNDVLRRPGAVPVLVYHSVSNDAGWLPWARNTSVRVAVFQTHLRTLRRAGYTVISRRTFQEARENGWDLPRRSVMLHFDDAYLDNWVAAVPLMRRENVPAAIFASSDFIDPSRGQRPVLGSANLRWDGYMTEDELRAVDEDPLFEVACHGADHARVPVASEEIGVIDAQSWKQHAPLFWEGASDKSRWYLEKLPPVPLGTPMQRSGSALTACRWTPKGVETIEAQEQRAGASLVRARATLSRVLGRNVDFLCWPFDETTERAERIARRAGFRTLTGGREENREDEDHTILSRTHINDFAAGPNLPLWVERMVFRAKVGVAAGNYWWMPLTTWAAHRRAKYFAAPKGPVS